LIILVSILDLTRLLGSRAARRNSIVSAASRSSRSQLLSTLEKSFARSVYAGLFETAA
jgi:hypothetical protein